MFSFNSKQKDKTKAPQYMTDDTKGKWENISNV